MKIKKGRVNPPLREPRRGELVQLNNYMFYNIMEHLFLY